MAAPIQRARVCIACVCPYTQHRNVVSVPSAYRHASTLYAFTTRLCTCEASMSTCTTCMCMGTCTLPLHMRATRHGGCAAHNYTHSKAQKRKSEVIKETPHSMPFHPCDHQGACSPHASSFQHQQPSIPVTAPCAHVTVLFAANPKRHAPSTSAAAAAACTPRHSSTQHTQYSAPGPDPEPLVPVARQQWRGASCPRCRAAAPPAAQPRVGVAHGAASEAAALAAARRGAVMHPAEHAVP